MGISVGDGAEGHRRRDQQGEPRKPATGSSNCDDASFKHIQTVSMARWVLLVRSAQLLASFSRCSLVTRRNGIRWEAPVSDTEALDRMPRRQANGASPPFGRRNGFLTADRPYADHLGAATRILCRCRPGDR